MNKIVVSLIILSFCYSSVFAQQNCIGLLEGYIKEMGKIGVPEAGKTYHLEMIIKNVPNNNDSDIPKEIGIEATISKYNMNYKSSLIGLYQDSLDVFVVLNPSKIIIWNRNTLNGEYEKRKDELLNIQMNIMERCSIIKCEDTYLDDQKYKVIDLQTDSLTRSSTKAESLQVYYNKGQDRIEKIHVFYGPKQPLKKQEIIYKDIDFNYKNKGSDMPVRQLFFDRSGNLRPEFQGFNLIDNRS